MWTLPNILTAVRILAAPAVAFVFLLLPRPAADWLALVMFVIAALTDFLDGWLARRYAQTTDIGRMLDPIADKAMVIIALTVLIGLHSYGTRFGPSSHYLLPGELVIPAVFIMLRETLVSGLREFLGAVKLHVTPLAKWKTTAQLVAIALLLAERPLSFEAQAFATEGPTRLAMMADALYVAGVLVLWLSAILTVVTGWDYFGKGLAYIRERERKET